MGQCLGSNIRCEDPTGGNVTLYMQTRNTNLLEIRESPQFPNIGLIACLNSSLKGQLQTLVVFFVVYIIKLL